MKLKIKNALTKLPPELKSKIINYENNIISRKGGEPVQDVTDCRHFISVFEIFILCDEVFIEVDEYL